ncbi:MAG: DUF1565 domain-containing protein, partial [Deltaproteobacteria bacterium]|nr:DUF1565 domain-containing protein [Deltaproteobacteria bacterium]MBW2531955.1 DUF1565 domain-containing protein [Deltaproteobacteria bacterium]
LAPGVAEGDCAAGFVSDGQSGCEPVLPAGGCASGMMAVPGDTYCRPVADCGDGGPFDGIPAVATTQHVDASYAGATSDGSAAQPHKTVADAVAAAQPGAIIALAPGSYEAIVLTKPLHLWGRCPEQVTISGSGVPAVTIEATATGSGIHRLALTGDDAGLWVEGASGVVVEQSWIHHLGGQGARILVDSELTLRDSLIQAATWRAVAANGALLRLERTEVRDTEPQGDAGYGVLVDGSNGTAASLTMIDSRIWQVVDMGVRSQGSVMSIERSVVSDVAPAADTSKRGFGVFATNDDMARAGALTVRDSVIARTHRFGVAGRGGTIELERTMIRDVAPEAATNDFGNAIYVWPDAAGNLPELTVRGSVLERCHDAGLWAASASVQLESSIVRDVLPAADNGFMGEGVYMRPDSDELTRCAAQVDGVVVERAHTSGMRFNGCDAAVSHSVVRAAQPGVLGLGTGIVFGAHDVSLERSLGVVRQSVVEDALVVGIGAMGADLSVEDVVVRRTAAGQNLFGDSFGDALAVSAVDPLQGAALEASLTISRATIEDSARAGVAAFSAPATLSSSLLLCNTIDLDAETLDDVPGSLEDGGDNVCGCGTEVHTCQVVSSDLQPPPLVGP